MSLTSQYFVYTYVVNQENPIGIRDRLINFDGKRSIFDLDRIICMDQIKVALDRTEMAFRTNKAVANVWGIELLVHLVGDHQISKCLDIIGINMETKRIGIIQNREEQPQGSISGLKIDEPSKELKELYSLPGHSTLCDEVITKGVSVIIDHE